MRIVSTGRQGRNPLWVSIEDEKTKSSDSGTVWPLTYTTVCLYCLINLLLANQFYTVCITSSIGDTSAAKCCVSLMPYTLVTPHFPPVCRPVLLLPSVLGRTLDKKLAGWQGFQLCEPGKNRRVFMQTNSTLFFFRTVFPLREMCQTDTCVNTLACVDTHPCV